VLGCVPEQTSAYAAVIDATQSSANNPDAVDKCLRQSFKLPTKQAISQTFLTTQGTGAIARLPDLGLADREKQALRVSYLATQTGRRLDRT
jgi:hypothetical protein